jgi:hypothetical protein
MPFTCLITSPPDRELLVAEIWDGNTQVAELNQEGAKLTLEVFDLSGTGRTVLALEEFLEAISIARNALNA